MTPIQKSHQIKLQSHNFGFIAGTLLGIGMELWTNRTQHLTISKTELKKVLREYTEKIPDHIDYLIDEIYDEGTQYLNSISSSSQ